MYRCRCCTGPPRLRWEGGEVRCRECGLTAAWDPEGVPFEPPGPSRESRPRPGRTAKPRRLSRR